MALEELLDSMLDLFVPVARKCSIKYILTGIKSVPRLMWARNNIKKAGRYMSKLRSGTSCGILEKI